MKNFSIVLFAAAVAFGGCCSSTVTTIVLVRHAERLNNSDTTSLSAAGLQRSNALRHAVDSLNLAAVFTTEKRRTQQTAQPTATAHGITPIVIPEAESQRLVDSLRGRLGQSMLVVGHSNTLPQIIEMLGITPGPAISGTEFDKLFILSMRSGGGTRLTRLQYGNASP